MHTSGQERVLIVGGSIAGQAVCERLSELGAAAQITLACGEAHPPYDRVNLGRLLTERSPEALSELALRPTSWYEDRGIQLRLSTWIERLDADAGIATTAAGERLAFDRAVLCTGSVALRPPIRNAHAPGVHVYRDPSDCAGILTDAARARSAAVIGGGLLGLEAACALAAMGVHTTVVHLLDRLMERQLDAPAAALLREAIERLGVQVELARRTDGIVLDGSGRARALAFSDGETLPCELVVIAVGIRPNVELALGAGLRVARGIVVDELLRSSHERVLAVGECAEHRGIVHGLVAPVREQAAVAARVLAGEDARYEGSVPSARLKVAGVELFCAGEIDGEQAVALRDGAAGSYRKLVLREGRAAGAILLGDRRGADLLADRIRHAQEVADPLALLAQASEASAADLPDGARVCNCNGVCKGEILAAIRSGLGSTREVIATTRAGSGCGSCRPLIAELVALERNGAAEEPSYLCPCRRLTREQLIARSREGELRSVSALADDCGAGRDCGACKPALAYMLSEIWAGRHREERHARFINDRVHANIQKDGSFSVVPRIRGGVTTPRELRRIAEVAEKYRVPMVKLTGGQRIDLLGVPKEQLPAIWEELGMASGHAYAKAVRTVKTCVGSEFCRFGLGDAIALGIELERAMEGLYTPHKVKSAVSGCPRNCAEAYVKDIGIVAVEGGWELYVGGAAGSRVRKGDLLTVSASAEQVKRAALAFLQHYREHAHYLERTYDFVERMGIEQIRRAVLEDEHEELLERYRIAKAAAEPDPWLERRSPATPKQFEQLDTRALALPEPGAAVSAPGGQR